MRAEYFKPAVQSCTVPAIHATLTRVLAGGARAGAFRSRRSAGLPFKKEPMLRLVFVYILIWSSVAVFHVCAWSWFVHRLNVLSVEAVFRGARISGQRMARLCNINTPALFALIEFWPVIRRSRVDYIYRSIYLTLTRRLSIRLPH